MKNISNVKISQIAVISFLILNQLSAIECVIRHIQCPKIIAKQCNCQSVQYFYYNCSKNNEAISLTDTTPAGNDDFRNQFVMEFNCTKVSEYQTIGIDEFQQKEQPI